MVDCQYREVMWIRHQNDKGYWWPGVFVKTPEEDSLLISALRGYVSSSIPKFGSACKVPLFFIPSSGTLVEATACAPYEELPCVEGMRKPFMEKAKSKMDIFLASSRAIHQGLPAVVAPATPSDTIWEHTCLAENLSIFPGSASLSARSASSRGSTSQESPRSYISDVDTELDLPATQLEPTLYQNAKSGIRGALTANMEIEEIGGTGTARKTAVRVAGDCSPEPPQSVAKRQRVMSSRLPAFPTPDSQMREESVWRSGTEELRSSSRCKMFCKESPSAPGSGTLFRHHRRGIVCDQNTGVGRRHSIASIEGIETSTNATHNVHHPKTSPASTVHEGGDKNKTPTLDPRESEAAAMREVGIGMDEVFKKLISKLIKIGWRYTNSPVSLLGSDTWIVKPGFSIGKARVGVEKFETPEAVVKYVQEVLKFGSGSTLGGMDKGKEGKTHQRPDTPSEEQDILNEDMEVCDDEIEENERGTVELGHGAELSPGCQVLQSVLEALQPSNAPPSLLKQRVAEYNQVLRFIRESISQSWGGSLYLCGCPGTGKTQTMTHVQEEIQRMVAKGKIPKPEFYDFRGTAFTEPDSMHNDLWHAIAGGVSPPHGVEKALRRRLTRSKNSAAMIVVVVDEIDQLMYQNRDVLRKLFEWADAPKSRLVLVGIANSMEFDVGFSGLKKPPAKVLFPAYSHENLVDILTERVGSTLTKGAIQLCARKLAATHGDARRAINVCREAVVLATRELQEKLDAVSGEERMRLGDATAGVPLVTIQHMSTALAGSQVSRYKDAIADLSVQAQIILCVAVAAVSSGSDSQESSAGEIKSEKRATLTQGDLQDKCARVWGKLRNGEGPSQVDFSGTVDMLADQGLVRLKGKQSTHGRARQLVLPIEMSDVEAALSSQPFYKTATSA